MTGITVAQPIWVYLIAVNICTFLVYGIDKQRAKSGRWRIPESRLLLLAAVGGSLGAWMGMYVFHHKTKKQAERLLASCFSLNFYNPIKI